MVSHPEPNPLSSLAQLCGSSSGYPQGFGHILSAFRYSYAVTQITSGWLVDSVGACAIYPGAVALWSLAGIATAFATSFGGLRACRFVLGIGEAFNWPCALKVTERLLPEKDRPLVNGIFNSGTAPGAMLAPLIVTILAVRHGWRSAFIATGLLGFVWVVLWLAYTWPFAPKLKSSTLRAGDALGVMPRILRERNVGKKRSSCKSLISRGDMAVSTDGQAGQLA